VIERMVILCGSKISADDVFNNANPAARIHEGMNSVDEFEKFQEFKDFAEKLFIKKKLEDNNWNVAKTAQEIDIQRSHLYNKIEKFGLKRTS
jgi:DNA-binding NtrC family response regulator